jgi:hypothetical protein
MKKIAPIWILAALIIWAMPALAGPITNNGNGTATDANGLMWLITPSTINMSFADAKTWAENLVFAGYDDWRLPSALNLNTGLPDLTWDSTNNEFGFLYGVEFGNPANAGDQGFMPGYTPVWFWTGTDAGAGEAYAFFWSWDGLWLIDKAGQNQQYHVTAVREAGAIPTPEPNIMLLLGIGLGATCFASRRRKK